MTTEPMPKNKATPEFSADKPNRLYQPPKLMLLESQIEGGVGYIQEASGGDGFFS